MDRGDLACRMGLLARICGHIPYYLVDLVILKLVKDSV